MGKEHSHCSGRLKHFKGSILSQILEEFLKNIYFFRGEAVDKASGKHRRDMRRRLNAVTLLVPKASDRKFVEIGLKTIAPVLVFYLQYDFVKHEFWKHKLMDACWSSSKFWKTSIIPFISSE
ncbi:hypothetical protein MTR67_011500 [Solanum verrucosum]|uniref:Uncharacterized protein n=1 Tax=Solanum verrucosum TaxID=315347 RepID=A0AAF0TM18_SOLVR|nr:hypothetical protein MTR67_011500 [Solanum verrucosum]